MKPGPVRPVLVRLSLLGALALVACTEKGGTTESGASTGESSSGSTSTATTGSSDPGTTGGIATVTSETNTTQDPECGPNTCGPCPEDCTAQDACVGGEWQCECACASTGASDSSSTGTPAMGCAADPPQFPEFDRSCADDSECTIVFHQVDCCGTLVAWGLSSAVGKMFGEAETQCKMEYGECECAAQPTTADDGKTAEDTTTIVVACVDGVCSSSVP
ncbi:MAG TPA: hypothetical protein VGB85_33335 [Nannocystis sp.]|jgi:hypothetical protein